MVKSIVASICSRLWNPRVEADEKQRKAVVAMRLFGKPNDATRKVTTGRFELEREGQVASLDYAYDGSVLQLIHTEVPEKLRGLGLASSLAESALAWARDHRARVDVVCPFVAKYVEEHPEYSDLVMK